MKEKVGSNVEKIKNENSGNITGIVESRSSNGVIMENLKDRKIE